MTGVQTCALPILGIFSRHSLYAFEDEIRQGFLTIEGGHRVGIAGKAVTEGSGLRTIRDISSLNIRLAHEKPGCGDPVLPWLYENGRLQNTLILSPPGAGKTTLLRDVVRQVSNGNRYGPGLQTAVVDERSELGACFKGVPQCDLGMRTDVMDGCPKALGMVMMIRSMAPGAVAVDEIGDREDLEALRYVMKCGCRILATVHGSSPEDLKKKPVLAEMVREGMFSRYVALSRRLGPGTVEAVCDGELRLLRSEERRVGKECRSRWKEKLELLLLFRQMMFYLKGQILYANATLPEAFREVGGRYAEGRSGFLKEPGAFFLRVAERLEEQGDVPFPVIWKEEAERFPPGFPLEAGDHKNLLALGENLGYAHKDMQERTLLFYLEETDGSIGFLKREMESRTKLYRCLGMAAGLFLMVVMA